MGTHPSGPAKVSSSSFLLDVLKQHNEIIGVVPDGYAVDDLPFLFKVLSIQTALSIQVCQKLKFCWELFSPANYLF